MGSVLSTGRRYLTQNGNSNGINNNNNRLSGYDTDTNQIHHDPTDEIIYTNPQNQINLNNLNLSAIPINDDAVNMIPGAQLTNMNSNPSHNNSRLNLINQLVTLSNNLKKSKSNNSNNLNDFSNISFASHFFLAGRKFKNLINQSQTFLFGDQLDLGFILSHKPAIFPYEAPSTDTPSNYIQSLINIRKDTLRLVKCCEPNPDQETASTLTGATTMTLSQSVKYNIEFKFDCDCDVRIKIYYFASERFVNSSEALQYCSQPNLNDNSQCGANQLTYTCGCSKFHQILQKLNTNKNCKSINQTSNSNETLNNKKSPTSYSANGNLPKCFCLIDESQPVIYKKGANILFQQPQHYIIPSKFHISAWQFNLYSNYYPIVIECRPVNEKLRYRHAHVTLAYLDKTQIIQNTAITPTVTSISNEMEPPTDASNLNLNKTLSVGCISTQIINHTYQIKPIKQKQLIDGVLYSLQEIYGIEKKSSDEGSCEVIKTSQQSSNKNISTSQTSISIGTGSTETTTTTNSASSTASSSSKLNEIVNKLEQERELELKGIECVICMSEIRDTLIMPCRHLCLCKICAINLRVQSNNCPICRIPFIALVQIKLFKKKDLNQQKDHLKENLNKLPIVTLNSMNDQGKLNEQIIEIHDKVESSAGNELSKKDMLLNSENNLNNNLTNTNKKNKTKNKLMEIYECVTIYEAFNTNLNNSSSCMINGDKKLDDIAQMALNKPKKNKSKSKKSNLNIVNTNPSEDNTDKELNRAIENIKNGKNSKDKIHELKSEIERKLTNDDHLKVPVSNRSISVIVAPSTSSSITNRHSYYDGITNKNIYEGGKNYENTYGKVKPISKSVVDVTNSEF